LFNDQSCWQFQVKRKIELAQPLDQAVELRSSQTNVRQIEFSIARAFIEQFEWLGNIGSSQLCYGLFNEGRLLSVSCYTRAVAPAGFSNLIPGAAPGLIYQLCRGATAPHAPKWAGSRVIGRSLSLLHAKTAARYVVAYADPRAGEIGVVYQSANAVYVGMTDARGPGEYLENGERLSPRAVHRRFGDAKDQTLRRIDPSYVRVQRIKKHRYLFVLGQGSAKRIAHQAIAHLRHPHPKRAMSAG
jgi:hypothetical protein